MCMCTWSHSINQGISPHSQHHSPYTKCHYPDDYVTDVLNEYMGYFSSTTMTLNIHLTLHSDTVVPINAHTYGHI